MNTYVWNILPHSSDTKLERFSGPGCDTARVCVRGHGHACAYVYVCAGKGKLSHLLWVISKLHKSFFAHQESAMFPPSHPHDI